MATSDDDLPVLNAVIRAGDQAIIRSSRLKHNSAADKNPAAPAPMSFELPAHLQPGQTQTSTQSTETTSDADSDKVSEDSADTDSFTRSATIESISQSDLEQAIDKGADAVESLIDQIVDNHILALRKDLRTLLERACKVP